MKRAAPSGPPTGFRALFPDPLHPSLERLNAITLNFKKGPILQIPNRRLSDVIIQGDVDPDAFAVLQNSQDICCLCASAVSSSVSVCLRGRHAEGVALAIGCISSLVTSHDVRWRLTTLLEALGLSGAETVEAFVLGGCLQGCSTEACGSLDLCEMVLCTGTEMGIEWTGVAVGLSQPTDFEGGAHLLPWTGRPQSVTVVLTPSWVGYANDPESGPALFDPDLITENGIPFPEL